MQSTVKSRCEMIRYHRKNGVANWVWVLGVGNVTDSPRRAVEKEFDFITKTNCIVVHDSDQYTVKSRAWCVVVTSVLLKEKLLGCGLFSSMQEIEGISFRLVTCS